MTLDAAQSIGPKPSRVTLEIPADNLCFILGAALAFRIWLLYYADNISSVLSTRVELTNGFIGLHYSIISPFFRNRDLREPLVREVGYLLKMGVSAYDFGTCLPMPLVVYAVEYFGSRGWESVLLLALDLAVAFYLFRIARLKFAAPSQIPKAVVAAYLLNPLSILSSGAKTIAPFVNLTLVGALYYALLGDRLPSLLLAAIATYTAIHPLYILAPVLSLLRPSQIKANALLFISLLAVLLAASRVVTGSWRFLLTSAGSRLAYSSLKPNVGLYWYLFIEMFDFFRPLFAIFLQLHSLFYWIPAGVRFRHDPLFMAFLLIGLQAILQPYPTVADATLYLSMIPLFPELYDSTTGSLTLLVIFGLDLRAVPLCLIALLFAGALAPVNWYYWIHQGSGNANFYYATTLLYNIPHVIILIDMMRAHLYTFVLRLNPDLRADQLFQK